MPYQTQTHQIQQLANGQNLEIVSHHFDSGKSGPMVYLQSNLHGAEVFGTFLLGRLIEKLKTPEDEIHQNFVGKIIIIPGCNPMGVLNVAYNSMLGRWNVTSGTNWNRIFSENKFSSRAEKLEFYRTQLESPNLSIEQKLASNLMVLANDADFIIDIHTTGKESLNHMFVHPGQSQYFLSLKPEVVIESTDPTSTAFDDANFFALAKSQDKPPITVTWEASSHASIEQNEIDIQLENLVETLNDFWCGNVSNSSISKEKTLIIPDTDATNLVSPVGGYYCWQKEIADVVEKDEVYAVVYQPHTNNFVEIRAKFKFILISKYGAPTISEGEQIAWIGRL